MTPMISMDGYVLTTAHVDNNSRQGNSSESDSDECKQRLQRTERPKSVLYGKIFSSGCLVEGELEMPKQHKVRKGTHSCWECRRRKVKCVFASPTDARCIICQRRDSTCTSQSTDSPFNTPQNRRYAEGLHNQTDNDPNVQSISPTLVLHGSTTSEVQQHRFPPRPLSPISNQVTPTELQRDSTIAQELLRSFPARTDNEILQERVNGISSTCYQFDYKAPLSTLHRKPETYVVKPDLLSPEPDPVLLAKQMLLFATALRYVSPTERIHGLSKHHHQIMEELAGAAIRLVTSNDSLLGSLECLESIILEAFYHTDSGDIRKAWITMRRAVMAAQLLGLHRRGHYRYKVIDDRNEVDPKTIWTSIVYMERVVSLLSGLPTSTDNIVLAGQEATCDVSNDCGLLIDLGNVAGRILERNQIELPQQALDITKSIDVELLRISANLSPTFWRPTEFSGLAQDSSHAFNEIRRVFDHSSYYTLVIQLHMPHMLCPSHSTQRMYSKMACVNASREILTRQIALRTFNLVTACCRMNDFMALIAGMTLMLAHATSHCDTTAGNVLAHQRLSDRAMVQRALECMTFVSELPKDQLAVRCASLLRDLLVIEESAARKSDQGSANNGEDRDFVITRAPFFGGIKLSKGGIAVVNPSRSEQNQSLSEDISIGGIGSIHVNTPSSDTLAPANVTSQPASLEPLQSQQDFLAQPDQILSDIAFDDWPVLGMDTAFFESLMQGSGSVAPDTTGTV